MKPEIVYDPNNYDAYRQAGTITVDDFKAYMAELGWSVFEYYDVPKLEVSRPVGDMMFHLVFDEDCGYVYPTQMEMAMIEVITRLTRDEEDGK